MPLPSDDYVAISNLLGRYCIAYDRGDADAMASIFADDGILENPEIRVEGSAALREMAATGDRSLARHISVPLVIEGDGDSANATSYIVVVAGPYDRKFGVTAYGTFEDTLERIDGHWRIKHRFIARPHHDDFDSLS